MMTEAQKITWESIRQRDLRVFEEYYKQHHQGFFVLACRYVRDVAIAREVVNDVFLVIWEKAPAIELESSLDAYIYRSVVNRCLKVIDKQQREARRIGEGPLPSVVTPESRRLEDHELSVRLYTAIDKLPEQCRRVFGMSRFEGLKQREIAERLGISLKTVKNHITHALKVLHRAVMDSAPLWLWGAVEIIFRASGPMRIFFGLISKYYGSLF